MANKQTGIIYARVPSKLRVALERERKRMSEAFGTEVKTSVVIRSLLERALRDAASERAA